jgi:hypothetical protein
LTRLGRLNPLPINKDSNWIQCRCSGIFCFFLKNCCYKTNCVLSYCK